MRKKRIRFYDISILDELFKRLLGAVSLLRGRGANGPSVGSSPRNLGGRGRGRGGGGRGGGGESDAEEPVEK